MRRAGEKRRLFPEGKAGARLREFRLERGARDTPAAQPPFGYATAIKLKEEQIKALNEPQPQWSPIGPFSIPHGQTYGSARPSVSGRISCIAIDPGDPAHILIGSAAGGIWETKNEGISWRPAQSGKRQFPMTIGAIAFLPGRNDIVYAGTGEGNDLSVYGVGLWKSTDGGSTWSEVEIATNPNPFIGLGFYSIVIESADPKHMHMLAATTGGLFHSIEGEAIWQPLLTKDYNWPCWDVSMHANIHHKVDHDANSTAEVLAATADGLLRWTDGGRNFQSRDGGQHFQPKDDGKLRPYFVPLDGAPKKLDRLAVRHAPS